MLSVITIFFLLMGLFFFFGTTIGLVRFPDFYSRMHAAGKGDTLSSVLLLIGLALYSLHDLSPASLLVTAKILFISIFIFVASPTATHAIMDAGYEMKIKPWTKRVPDLQQYSGPERRQAKEKHP